MTDAEILVQLLVGNGVGVAFGLLMYRMVTTTVKDMTLELKTMNANMVKLIEIHSRGKDGDA